MKIIAIVLALVAAAASFVADTEWSDYKAEHNKMYDTLQEDQFRKNIYEENKKRVQEHNKKFEDGLVSFKIRINQFSDMTHDEYLKYAKCLLNGAPSSDLPRTQYVMRNISVPDSFDWREKGAVTPIKDQGGCGSCYAFSVTGSVEGQHFIKTQKLVELSEQNIVDCAEKCMGCNGCVTLEIVFQYIIDNGGIDTETSYPYEDIDHQKCRYDPKNSGATITSYVDIPSGDEEALKQAVALQGPISVGINVRDDKFHSFHGDGVYDNPDCIKTELDHAVLVVGYGNHPTGGDYWLVKNSWGLKFGDQGYIKMARNKDNQCGIASAAVYPKI